MARPSRKGKGGFGYERVRFDHGIISQSRLGYDVRKSDAVPNVLPPRLLG